MQLILFPAAKRYSLENYWDCSSRKVKFAFCSNKFPSVISDTISDKLKSKNVNDDQVIAGNGGSFDRDGHHMCWHINPNKKDVYLQLLVAPTRAYNITYYQS